MHRNQFHRNKQRRKAAALKNKDQEVKIEIYHKGAPQTLAKVASKYSKKNIRYIEQTDSFQVEVRPYVRKTKSGKEVNVKGGWRDIKKLPGIPAEYYNKYRWEILQGKKGIHRTSMLPDRNAGSTNRIARMLPLPPHLK